MNNRLGFNRVNRKPVVCMIPQLQINTSWTKYIPVPANLSELSDLTEIQCKFLEIL